MSDLVRARTMLDEFTGINKTAGAATALKQAVMSVKKPVGGKPVPGVRAAGAAPAVKKRTKADVLRDAVRRAKKAPQGLRGAALNKTAGAVRQGLRGAATSDILAPVRGLWGKFKGGPAALKQSFQHGARGGKMLPGANTGAAHQIALQIGRGAPTAKAALKSRAGKGGMLAGVLATGSVAADKAVDSINTDKPAATPEEIDAHRKAVGKDKDVNPAKTNAPKAAGKDIIEGIPDEVTAGVGGGIAGAGLGYGVADTMGADGLTGALVGGVGTAGAAALLANYLKKQKAK